MRLSHVVAALGLFAVLSGGAAAFASPAQAQAAHIDGAARFDVHLGIGWEGSVGPGFRVDFPLSRTGLIRSVDDEFALTLGADLLFFAFDRFDDHHHRYWVRARHDHIDDPHYFHDIDRRGDVTLLFPIALQWNFIVHRRWSFYPEAGLAIEQHYSHVHVLPDLGFGARWPIGGAAFLLRATFPGALQIGIAW